MSQSEPGLPPGPPPSQPNMPVPVGGPPPAPVAGPPPAPAPTGPPGWQPPVEPVETKTGPGLLVRAIWFLLVGWWLTGIVSVIAWAAMITIIGLPLGIWLINRIPTVITLRPRTREVQQMVDAAGFSRLVEVPIQQPPWWVRGIWFVFVGWWASAFVMAIGWALVVFIVTLPVGLLLFNRVPFVASLYRY